MSAANALPAHEASTRAMLLAYNRWGAKDPKYKKMYKRVDAGNKIIEDAMAELPLYQPNTFYDWWPLVHMRYQKIKHEEQLWVHELLYHFFTRYYRGTLGVGKK